MKQSEGGRQKSNKQITLSNKKIPLSNKKILLSNKKIPLRRNVTFFFN